MKYEIPKYRKNITGKIRDMYAKYFNIKFLERDDIDVKNKHRYRKKISIIVI